MVVRSLNIMSTTGTSAARLCLSWKWTSENYSRYSDLISFPKTNRWMPKKLLIPYWPKLKITLLLFLKNNPFKNCITYRPISTLSTSTLPEKALKIIPNRLIYHSVIRKSKKSFHSTWNSPNSSFPSLNHSNSSSICLNWLKTTKPFSTRLNNNSKLFSDTFNLHSGP